MAERERILTTRGRKDGIKTDRYGRMMYHPDFHPNHKKPFTEEEMEYICKFYDIDGPRAISFALGRTEKTIMTKINTLKKSGLYEKYRNSNYYV